MDDPTVARGEAGNQHLRSGCDSQPVGFVASVVPGTASRVWFRVGLVLAGLMGLFNTINGVGTLADPSFGQTDPTAAVQPGWMSVSLVVFGVATLSALIPAWRGVRGAIIAVALSRLAPQAGGGRRTSR